MNKGLIYKITNIVNNKSYIGQTKSIIKNDIEIGLLKRWKEHKNRNACPYFYNAIQKHGINNFKLEILIYCNVFHLDYYEKKYISLYSTNNKLFGYNLTDGGKGVISSSEYIREKISLSQNGKSMNIKEVFRNNKLVGYRVYRKINGQLNQKYFTSQKNTIEKNLELSQEYLFSLKHKLEYNNIPFNRLSGTILPKNIKYYINKNKEIKGYVVHIIKNKKVYKKNFGSSELSMEEKYKLAIDYKEKIMMINNTV